jgi:hypothetical protein
MPAPSKARWDKLVKVDAEFSPDDIVMERHREVAQTHVLAKLLAKAEEHERAKEYIAELTR